MRTRHFSLFGQAWFTTKCPKPTIRDIRRELNTLCGISTSKTTPYHPMGDGQVERRNKTIINMLKTLNENQKSNWKKQVSKMLFVYHSTINKATGFSPFYSMFDQSSRLPIDSMFDMEADGNKRTHKTYEQFVNTWKASMQKVLTIVKNVTK